MPTLTKEEIRQCLPKLKCVFYAAGTSRALPVPDHPFYALPNCVLTPHIAGSLANETHRMAEYMAEEFVSFEAGKPTHYEVTEKMLETMA